MDFCYTFLKYYSTKKEHLKGNELMDNFNTSQFTVRLSRDTYTQLRQQKKQLSEKKHSLLWNVIQEHLYLDVYEGLPRSKSQIDSSAGAMTEEANRQTNKAKVYYGFLKPDVAPLPKENDDEGEDGEKPKKKKKKENILAQKLKKYPNANNGLHSNNQKSGNFLKLFFQITFSLIFELYPERRMLWINSCTSLYITDLSKNFRNHKFLYHTKINCFTFIGG